MVVGKDVDFGNFIICQSLNNKRKFYILGHLKTISVNKNDILSPGSKLGKAGNTGKCYSKCGGVFKNSVRVENYPQYFNAGWGTHLHVSVLKYDKELVCSDCLSKVQRGGTTEPSFKWKIELNYVDPFDYERPYKGLVSIPGRE